jgi:hypothetical protein
MNLEKMREKLHARGASPNARQAKPELTIPARGAHDLARKGYLFRDRRNDTEKKKKKRG